VNCGDARKEEDMMGKIFVIAIALFCIGGLPVKVRAEGKILVAYFSWSGNAKALAGQIAEATGGDLFEIKTAEPYPDTYEECTKAARRELDSNARPALSGSVSDMTQYGTVFLCYPNWWGTLPMGVFTFLEAYDFSGKTIYPLVTHGGSSFGRSLGDMKKLCPSAVIGEGFSVSAFDTNPKDNVRVTTPNGDVTAWLREIVMTK
jgi:flavodoxin